MSSSLCRTVYVESSLCRVVYVEQSMSRRAYVESSLCRVVYVEQSMSNRVYVESSLCRVESMSISLCRVESCLRASDARKWLRTLSTYEWCGRCECVNDTIRLCVSLYSNIINRHKWIRVGVYFVIRSRHKSIRVGVYFVIDYNWIRKKGQIEYKHVSVHGYLDNKCWSRW